MADEAATVKYGAWLADQLSERYAGRAVVFLHGSLGAGKTTLVRGVLQALGHSGAVKSPTYTLLEPYTLNEQQVFHFDLYRVNDPQELEFIGIDEIVDGPGLKLFEWPQRALDWLPGPDVEIQLEVIRNTDDTSSRRVHVEFH